MKNLLFILLLSSIFGTVTDIDGNVYETVQIGQQLWMAENLKVTHYNNGDDLSVGFSDNSGSYVIYDNNIDNIEIYGNLYNWYAVDDDRDICPEGWHVPSVDEFELLNNFLGDSSACKLKSNNGLWWNEEICATNESGFTAHPAGKYGDMGGSIFYDGIGGYTWFWSSDDYGFAEHLNYNDYWSQIINDSKETFYSIRCLSDELHQEPEVLGCTDELACNYNSDANTDDGSCDYSCHDNGDYSLYFDGADDYVKGSSTSLDISDTNKLTLFAKIKPNLPQSYPNGTVFTHTSDGSAQNQYSLRIAPDGRMYFVTAGSIGSDGSFEDEYTANVGNNSLLPNEFSDVAITYDGESLKFYINGVLDYENQVIDNFPTDYLGDFLIGRDGGSPAFYKGYISQISIWNQALTQEELISLSDSDTYYEDVSLLAHWKFNSNTGETLYDYSGNQNHGTIYGAVWPVEGCTDELACNYNSDANTDDDSCDYSCHDNGDYSLYFEGDDIVQIDNFNTNYQDITVCAWIKADSISGNGSWDNVVDAYYQDGSTPFRLGFVNNELRFGYENGDAFWASVYYSSTDWNFIVGTREFVDGNYVLKLFINSNLVDTFSASAIPDLTQSSQMIAIGDNATMHNDENFKGKIDNVSIFNKALSEEDVSLYYQSGISWEDNIIGYWLIDEGFSSIIYDYSGNQNHGLIYGAEWVENIILGDLNSDANIDILDIIILMQIIAFSGEYNELGDINGDGTLNILDAVALVMLILNN